MLNSHHFKNQSGFTLIELLAALALFSLVTLLGLSLLFSAQGSQASINENIQLQKHTNNLMMDLRKQHKAQLADATLDETHIVMTLSPHESIEVTRLIVNGEVLSNPAIIDNVTNHDTIQIEMTTALAGETHKNKHHENHIHTVLNGTSPHTITVRP